MASEIAVRSFGSTSPDFGHRFLVQRGADLVHVLEDLYGRLFLLTLVLLLLSSGWSVWANLADPQRGQLVLTVAFAVIGMAAATASITRRNRVYRWLRYSRARQVLPAMVAVGMMLADGPHSPAWWIAFASLFVVASVSSTSLTLVASVVAGAAYIGGTLLYQAPLVYQGDTTNIVGAAMLVVDALVARAVAEAFGSFVLRLHRIEAELAEPVSTPVRVKNIATPVTEEPRPTNGSSPRQAVRRRRSLLTARQLEVVLLVRDGLHQDEIANCLSISTRQVKRLIEQARQRVSASTTSELVAMLVQDRLVPGNEAAGGDR